MTTSDRISYWFEIGVRQGATHMILKRRKDGECLYPIFVKPGENPKTIDARNTDSTVRVYDLDEDAKLCEA